MTENTDLQVVVNNAGLAQEKSKALLEAFVGFFNQARTIATEAEQIVVTDVSQVEQMQQARTLRRQLQDIRTKGVEATRVQLKEQSLREGKAIDGIANVIKALIVPVEKHLEAQEKYAERIEAERKEKVKAQRIAELGKYVENAENYTLHPDTLNEATYQTLLENSRLAYEAKLEAQKQAEKAAKEAEEAEKKRQIELEKENERLRREAEKLAAQRAKEQAKLKAEAEARAKAEAAAKAKADAERAEQEAKLKKEREAREALEAKIKAAAEASEQAKRAEEERQRQALLAPDKEKLVALAEAIANIEYPAVKTETAILILAHTKQTLTTVVKALKEAKL